MIKLIASDMDGTLLNDNHDIDLETVKAINEAEKAGIVFTISTGREYGGVKGILNKHNLKCQCILSNGAEYRDENGKILEVVNINEEYAKEIIMIFEKNNLSARIFTNKGVFTTSTREEAFQEVIFRTMTLNPSLTEKEARKIAEKENFFTMLKYIDNIDNFFKSGIEIRKFVAFNKDIELINRIKEIIAKIDNIAVSSSFYDNIEITHFNAQKGIILEKVAKKMNINNNEVMILGDSFNDYSMFEIFEESVAMENAIPEVKSIAKYITDSNNNLGVAKAIRCGIKNEMDTMLK